MTRQIILDTETTGLEPTKGDRIIEVAAIELVNLLPTGAVFHQLVDPLRDVPADSTRIHGFTEEMLHGKPLFEDILPGLLDFLGDDPIVAHNAPFDFGFLDMEFDLAGVPRLDRGRMVDSLDVAKRRFPGMPNSLDALCRRLGIDNSMRTSHNAILDCKLLAQVYLELMGGKQPALGLAVGPRASTPGGGLAEGGFHRGSRLERRIIPNPTQIAAHSAFLGKIKEPLWLKVEDSPDEGCVASAPSI